MTDALGGALPWPQSTGRRTDQTAAETTPGGSASTPWVVVAHNLNPGEAAIIKGRLESEEIPAVVKQEALGSVLGLTVGPLGSAQVLVPEPMAEQALELLAETFEADEEDWADDDEWFDEDESGG